MKNLIVVTLITLCVGCSSIKDDFVFDGSTEASTQAGIVKVMKRLRPKDRLEFMTALMAIQFYDVKSASEVVDDPTMVNEMNYFIIGKKIDGLNYQQVIELAKTSPTKVEVIK
ncbi:DUF6694 family lipoprotein [Ferrimonas sp. YFM]|uniref:DUF6694 family lipoprotein n=1 Tax=Ferrimonas sp. YFM TaxID=3028878 RepID=UPI002574557D|nr:DUF6694 family lipoprotein [Ferrimonas sp. YFM]